MLESSRTPGSGRIGVLEVEMDASEVVNGSFWLVKRNPNQAVALSVWAQYLYADQWVLLATPAFQNAPQDGFYLANTSPYEVNGFPTIMTREQIARALTASFAEREHRYLSAEYMEPSELDLASAGGGA